jgi:hypothetical protein
MRWGLVPFWVKDIKVQRRRCPVPVDPVTAGLGRSC